MSTHPEPLDDDLGALAERLRAMPLAPAAVARDQLFFRAGQASEVGRRRRRFAVVTSLLTCVALGGGVLMGRWSMPGPEVVEKLIVVREQLPPTPQAGQAVPGPMVERPPDVVEVKEPVPVVEWVRSPGPRYANTSLDVLFSKTDPVRPMLPLTPPNISVEDLLGLPAGTLSDVERTRWTKTLNLRGDL